MRRAIRLRFSSGAGRWVLSLSSLRSAGLGPLALSTVLLAAALAGGVPIWAALLLALSVAVLGLVVATLGRRADQAEGPGAQLETRIPAHVRASALTGQVLVIVIVAALCVEFAQSNFGASPWSQLAILAGFIYVAGLIGFGKS
jgi:hypothetical protein